MILKICITHGELKEHQLIKEFRINKIYYRCKECRQLQNILYKHKNREKGIVYSIKWKKENREHINTQTREDRIKNPEKYREWARKNRQKSGPLRSVKQVLQSRGLTYEDYEKMLKNQNHVCFICKMPETRRSKNSKLPARLCIDHCHKTNTVRGLLCHGCNQTIGHAKDSRRILQNAIEYLRIHAA